MINPIKETSQEGVFKAQRKLVGTVKKKLKNICKGLQVGKEIAVKGRFHLKQIIKIIIS